MTTRARVLLWTLVAALAASAVACGSSTSVTGPSGSSRSGAVISGRVNVAGNAALGVATRFPLAVMVAVPLASTSSNTVTVTIVGTNTSTTLDGSGTFTLDNVPPGTVQLRFQGRGSDAMLTISGIEADDHINIAVTLNGNSARLDSKQVSGDKRVEVNGRIDSIDMGTRMVRVGSQMVLVSANIPIRHGNRTFTLADLRVGDHIQVKGSRDGTTVVASEIKVEPDDGEDDDDDDDNDNNELRGSISSLAGTCPALSFFVAGTKVTTNAATKYEDTSCSSLRNDMRVDVDVMRASDGSLVAIKVERD